MLISHCHVQSAGFGLEVESNPAAGTLPELRRIMQALGVDRAVAFAPFGPQEGVEANEWLAQQLEDYPELIGFATVNPADEQAPEKLRRCTQRGLVGAKVHPPIFKITLDDPALDPFWQAAEELRLPVHIHTGVHGWHLRRYMPMLLDDVCQRHPELRIIMDHLGGIAMFDQALGVLHNNPHSYAGLTQLSGRDPRYALSEERLRLLLDTVGPERIIYGFDYPWNEDNLAALEHDLAWIRSWGLSDADEAKILGGNMERLLPQ